MNEVIQQTIYFIISYVGIVFFFFFGVNWLSKGWLMSFVKVKASRGKKLIVMCHGLTGTYYRVGFIDRETLRFKDIDKSGRAFTNVKREDVIHLMGVQGIEVDIPGKTIIQRGYAKPGCDPVETDNFLNRIIMSPQIQDKWKQYILIVMVLILLLIIINLYFSYNIFEILNNLKLQGVIQ